MKAGWEVGRVQYWDSGHRIWGFSGRFRRHSLFAKGSPLNCSEEAEDNTRDHLKRPNSRRTLLNSFLDNNQIADQSITDTRPLSTVSLKDRAEAQQFSVQAIFPVLL